MTPPGCVLLGNGPSRPVVDVETTEPTASSGPTHPTGTGRRRLRTTPPVRRADHPGRTNGKSEVDQFTTGMKPGRSTAKPSWDVDPFGSGCIPGTHHRRQALVDTLSAVATTTPSSSTLVWESTYAGVIGEDEVFPNDYVLNDNPIIRTLASGDGV